MIKMNLSPLEKGKIGEKYAEKYLKKNGYKILERNMRNEYSEIDIIAESKEYIIFVEVKSRTSENYLSPSASVDFKKQKKIMTAASHYIKVNNIVKQPRFDIAEVFLSLRSCKPYRINYIENAFVQGGDYAVF